MYNAIPMIIYNSQNISPLLCDGIKASALRVSQSVENRQL